MYTDLGKLLPSNDGGAVPCFRLRRRPLFKFFGDELVNVRLVSRNVTRGES